MSNLKENLKFFKLEESISIPDVFEVKELYEDLINELDYDVNRAMYIMYKNQNIQMFDQLFENMGEKSIIVYFYDEISDLFNVLTRFTKEQLKSKFFCFSSNLNDTDIKTSIDNFLSMSLYKFTNMVPVLKLENDLNYIKTARDIIQYIREKRDNFNFKLGNDVNDTLYGFDNRLKNLNQYSEERGLKSFIESAGSHYKNKPAVIVSSGPSLDKNIHVLKEYQDKVLIFSCDGSYTTLIKNGITPHFIGSVERIKKTYEAFYEEKDIHPQVILLAPAVVRPEIPRQFRNRMLSFFKDGDTYGVYFDKLLNEKKGRIWCGSSVAHLLYNAAKEMGADPIILIGQDLSYTNDGVSHADDSEVKEHHDISKISVWLKGNYVDRVPSQSVWEKFLIEFVDIISDNPGTTINATEGGAYIKGSEISSLREALDIHAGGCVESPMKIFSSMRKEKISKESRIHIKNQLVDFLNKYMDYEKKCKEALDNNLEITQGAYKGIETQEQLDSIYDLLDDVDGNIVKEIMKDPEMSMLFQYPIHSAIRKINAMGTKSYDYETIIGNLEVHQVLLKDLLLNCRKMIRLLYDNGLEFEGENYDWIHDSIYEIDRI